MFSFIKDLDASPYWIVIGALSTGADAEPGGLVFGLLGLAIMLTGKLAFTVPGGPGLAILVIPRLSRRLRRLVPG
jgi:hypothetical protein